jgi:sugar phosphate isomerase/epimerase
MQPSRREVLAAWAGAVPAVMDLLACAAAGDASGPQRMGVVSYSYALRLSAGHKDRLADPLAFLEYCRSLGAGGVQVPLGVRDEAWAAAMRKALARDQMYLEGSVRLPRDARDVDRFRAEVDTARRCGAGVLRTALLGGRRYEVFASAGGFRAFAEQSRRSLALARPVVEKRRVRLAVENHKDWRAGELVELIQWVSSSQVGVCVDTGNSIALLENPLETVRTLAPHAFSTHIKDMGVREYEEGFLLSEVPLGEGFLDLGEIVGVLRRARPEVRLNLEMITRDPLKVPCLTGKYWTTLEVVSGRQLAEALARVRAHAFKGRLPRVGGLSRDEQVRREDENVRRCLRYAHEKLGC